MIKYTRTITVMIDEEKFKDWEREEEEFAPSNDTIEDVARTLDDVSDDYLFGLVPDEWAGVTSVDGESEAEMVE